MRRRRSGGPRDTRARKPPKKKRKEVAGKAAGGGGGEDVPKNVPFSDVPKNASASSSSSLYSSADADAPRARASSSSRRAPQRGRDGRGFASIRIPDGVHGAHPRARRSRDAPPSAPPGKEPSTSRATVRWAATSTPPSRGWNSWRRWRARRRPATIAATRAVVAAADWRVERRRQGPASRTRVRDRARAVAAGAASRGNAARERGSRRGPSPPPPPPPDVDYRAGAGIGAAAPGLTGLTVVAPPPPPTPWARTRLRTSPSPRIATTSDTSTSVSRDRCGGSTRTSLGNEIFEKSKDGSVASAFRARWRITRARGVARNSPGTPGTRAAAATLEEAAGGTGVGEERRVVVGVCGADPAEKIDEYTDGGGGRRGVGPEGGVRPASSTRNTRRRKNCDDSTSGQTGSVWVQRRAFVSVRSYPFVRIRSFDSVKRRAKQRRAEERRDAMAEMIAGTYYESTA